MGCEFNTPRSLPFASMELTVTKTLKGRSLQETKEVIPGTSVWQNICEINLSLIFLET